MKRSLLVLILAALLGGCATPLPRAGWQRCELFFGFAIPGGGEVSAGDWQAFVDGEVTPRFPQGLTVLPAQGQWRNAAGHVEREPSRVLVLLLPDDDAGASARIDELRSRYRERFRQEAVGRACTAAQVVF
ncbi:DUF3574 domain-containing protein [Aquincola sp. S2]|uniref:DUF3574 domain-containing protein n=1 Tax=Pseudaquabacterium terrae TaxID=2732868 RepID=A0ABX2EI51_9BURK|nr:DUF3574 domain-containing protein [Aquabacterium terrae]NRF68299.1 DUF3574 domain-containing protein [Aquabacterium terrae]